MKTVYTGKSLKKYYPLPDYEILTDDNNHIVDTSSYVVNDIMQGVKIIYVIVSQVQFMD